jgi:hypothetical protein
MSDTHPRIREARWPDTLSAWVMPPGEVEPVRAFDSAEATMMFLARWNAAAVSAAGRQPRYLKATTTH